MMPHSQTSRSMAWIRSHGRTPAVRYVCPPLMIPWPFNHGPTSCGALRLNRSTRHVEDNASLFMWQEYNRVQAAVGVYAWAFMFILCYGLVTACKWDPCVAKKKRKEEEAEEAIFIIMPMAAGQWNEWKQEGLWKAWPCSTQSPLSISCTPDCSWQQREYQTCS